MGRVSIFIAAYNAEKTIINTIESILKQTYKYFDLFICDNGSTDGTLNIIKNYCAKYDFISYYSRKFNFTGSFMASLYGTLEKDNDGVIGYYKVDEYGEPVLNIQKWGEWVCYIDSDDTIQPTYLEDMLSYANDNLLDMVMCGWDFVRPNRVDHRIPEKYEVIYRNQFAERLPYYDKFMGPVWNKLFRVSSMAKNISYYENKYAKLFKDGVYFYGGDTAFNYFYLGGNLDKFGIVPKSLYNYYIHDVSASRKNFNPMRIIADRRMAEVRLDFLQELGAEITDENKEFIMNIYLKSSKSTMELILNDDRYDLKQKMANLHEMFDCDLMREVFPLQSKRYL